MSLTDKHSRFFILGLPHQGLQQWHLIEGAQIMTDAEVLALKASEKWQSVLIVEPTAKINVETKVERSVQRTGAVYRPDHDDPSGPHTAAVSVVPTPEGYKLTSPANPGPRPGSHGHPEHQE